jgi:hypothetical protein
MSMGGLNLYMGNYQHTPLTRAWAAVDLPVEKAWYHGHENELAGLNEAEKQKWAVKEAQAFMLENPGLSLKRAVIKAANFWGLERSVLGVFANGHFAGVDRKTALILTGPVLILFYLFVMMTDICGIFTIRGGGRGHYLIFCLLLIGFVTAMHALTFGHARYHLPFISLLLPFSAAFSMALSGRLQDFRRSRLVKAAAFCIIMLTLWTGEVLLVEGSRFFSKI